MPQIVPIILTIAGMKIAGFAGALVGAGLGAWFMSSRAGDIDTEDNSPAYVQGNFSSTEVIIPIVYGQMLIGGNDVYMGTSGPDNNYLWIVQTLSEGECDRIYTDSGVDQLFLDDTIHTDYGDAQTGPLVRY